MTTIKKYLIVRKIKKNPIIINTINNKPKVITGIIEFIDSRKPLACYFSTDNIRCNLYECMLKSGKLYYSDNIVGDQFYLDLNIKYIRKYNENCQNGNDMIKCIYLPNGSILYP